MNYLIKTSATIILSFIMLYTICTAEHEGVKSFVTQVSNKAIQIVTSTSTSEAQKKAQVKNFITQYFDIPWMAKFTPSYYSQLPNMAACVIRPAIRHATGEEIPP